MFNDQLTDYFFLNINNFLILLFDTYLRTEINVKYVETV